MPGGYSREELMQIQFDRLLGLRSGAISLRHVRPPIPTLQIDWCATYDDDEPDDNGNMLSGYGATEWEALEDLANELESKQPENPEGKDERAALKALEGGE